MNSKAKTNSLEQLNSLKQKELIKYTNMLQKYTPSVAQIQNSQISQDSQTSTNPKALESSLSLAFEILAEQFNVPSVNDVHTLDTVSTILYKLVSSFTQIKSTEIKSQELLIKEKEFLLKKEELEMKKARLKPENAKGLTPETLCLIEQQLKLL